MAKSWDYGKKNKSGSFSPKRRKNLQNMKNLRVLAFLQEISNNKRFKIKQEYLED